MIKFENVNYIYSHGRNDEVHALRDISLEIPQGKITALIGASGSGKSTLIKLINGLERPVTGRVFAGDTEVTDKKTDLRALRFRVGMVFQYPEQQLFEETVEKDIAFGPANMGLDKAEIAARVKKAAGLVGLDEKKLDSSPFELSGGEKRRAAIAGVLAMEPEILLLDEPTAGLDPEGARRILELISRLHRENPLMTIVFVSHSMEDVVKYAHNAIVLDKGSIAASGSIDEVFAQTELLNSIGLGLPQITSLCRRLNEVGFNIPEDIYTPSGAAEYIMKELRGNA